MAYSTQRAVSDGTMAYLDVSIQYMKRGDINVFYNDLPADPATWAWVGTTDKRIAFTPNVPDGVEVLLKRSTQINTIINVFSNGAKFNNATMDQDFTQLLYLNQEAVEGAALTDIFNDVDFHGYKIKNVGAAVDDTDVVSFGQLKTMSTGAYAAQLAAEAARDLAAKWASQLTTTVDGTSYSAKQYALNAAASATSAAGSATAASSSASAASGSASTATSAKVAAQTAQAAAESARDDAQAAAAPATELVEQVEEAVETANAAAALVATAAQKGANSDITSLSGLTTPLSVQQGGTGTDAGIARGDCYLSLSGGNLLLSRKNGNLLTINGQPYVIPAAGVTLAPTGAVAATFYYIYAAMVAGVMTLEYSTTGHSQDANTGVEIKTGDATRTLVGAAYCVTAGTWTDDVQHVYVLSWFNRKRKVSQGSQGTTATTSTNVEISANARAYFITWVDNLVDAHVGGTSYSLVTNGYSGAFRLYLDGITSTISTSIAWSSLSAIMPYLLRINLAVSEGTTHYFTLYHGISNPAASVNTVATTQATVEG